MHTDDVICQQNKLYIWKDDTFNVYANSADHMTVSVASFTKGKNSM